MRKILALLFCLWAIPASAQVSTQAIPSNTVIGRIGNGSPGYAEAIPFSTLFGLFGGNVPLPITIQSSTASQPQIILDNTTGGTASLFGWEFEALNGASTGKEFASIVCGSGPVITAGSEQGECQYGILGPSATTYTITQETTGSATGCFLCSPDTDNVWSLGTSSIRWAALYSHTGNFSGTVTLSGQLVPAYGTPTIASGACGSSTNGTIASGGTNQSGEVVIASATTTTCTVGFSATLGSAPLACLLTAGNSQGASEATNVYVSAITTAHFVITGTALASTDWYYHCF